MEGTWHEQIRAKRKHLELTQKRVALRLGITLRHLNRLENGACNPSASLQMEIDRVLDTWSDEPEITLMIDYLRVRFPTCDVTWVINEVLGLDRELMLHESYAYFGYQEMDVFGEIQVMTAAGNDTKRGVLVEMKGKGCRHMEGLLLTHNQTWFDFFRRLYETKCVFKRLDLAINDKVGLLDIAELIRKCDRNECISVMRHFEAIRSGHMNDPENNGKGNTLYIGSRKSGIYFCLYEKMAEQLAKYGAQADTSIINRLEIRLTNDRASIAVEDLLSHRDAERTAFGIIKRYIRFVDPQKEKPRLKWPINKHWEYFCGQNRVPLRLTLAPEPFDLNRTRAWIAKQVGPMEKVIMQIDGYYGNTDTMETIRDAKLSKKHLKILEQFTTGKDSLEGDYFES